MTTQDIVDPTPISGAKGAVRSGRAVAGMALLAGAGAFAGVWLGRSPASTPIAAAVPAPPAASQPLDHPRAELVLIAAETPWMATLIAPALSRIGTGQRPARLLAVHSETMWMGRHDRLTALLAPRRSLLLVPAEPVTPDAAASEAPEAPLLPDGLGELRTLQLPSLPGAASCELARTFWSRAETVVAAPGAEVEAVLLAGCLAAHRGVPLLLFDHPEELPGVWSMAAALQAREVLLVAAETVVPGPLGDYRGTVTPLDPAHATAELILQTRGTPTGTLLLARTPDADGPGATAWFAPYWSVYRDAPLLLCRDSDPVAAETLTRNFLAASGLRPRSITILASPEDIGYHTHRVPGGTGDAPEQNNDWDVQAELFTIPQPGRALSLAVGRIPCFDPAEASGILTASLHRAATMADSPSRMVMIANPNPEIGPLPLCETVARLAVADCDNAGLAVDAFYQMPDLWDAVRTASADADMIVYQGHISDCFLFDDGLESAPTWFGEDGNRFADQAPWPLSPYAYDSPPDYDGPLWDAEWSAADDSTPTWSPDTDQDAPPWQPDERFVDPRYACETVDGEGGEGGEDDWQPPIVRTAFRRLPLVVLQSCTSLDDSNLTRIREAGGVGLLGSTTRIHSASGSSFWKAVSDSMVYRNRSIGEAVRDARNLFFCLYDLKNLRKHRQQAKAYRVALSFQLWGDPELRFLKPLLPQPRLPPPVPVWTAEGIVEMPAAPCLPQIATHRYHARFPPAAKAAGIVDRAKDGRPRNVLPLRYAELPIPANLMLPQRVEVRIDGKRSRRAVARRDESDTVVHLLYLPNEADRDAGPGLPAVRLQLGDGP